jgi:hypothetical protein
VEGAVVGVGGGDVEGVLDKFYFYLLLCRCRP